MPQIWECGKGGKGPNIVQKKREGEKDFNTEPSGIIGGSRRIVDNTLCSFVRSTPQSRQPVTPERKRDLLN